MTRHQRSRIAATNPPQVSLAMKRARALAQRNPVDVSDLQVRDVISAVIIAAFMVFLLVGAGLISGGDLVP